MAFELFTRVALREDFPKYQLHRGDIATSVEYHPVANGEDGYRLEVFNAIGEMIAVLVVSESQIEPYQRYTKNIRLLVDLLNFYLLVV